MSNSKLRVLLTGGAGFIGSHLAEALLRRGADLTIVDKLDDFYSPDHKRANLEEVRRAGKFEFVHADLCEIDPLREIVKQAAPDVMVHLAARAGVRPSIEQPLLYERVNVAATVNLLQLCRELKVPKFVFGSSSSVYGATSKVPFSEANPELRPISPYAATKLSCELFCYTYAHLFQIQTLCLRFFTVYGPRQRPDLAIHKFIGLIEDGKPLPIFGDWNSGRDYTYVDDTVAGILAAVDYKFNVTPGEAPFDIFNLGNSHPVKLGELVELIEAATGRKAIRNAMPAQPGDVPITWADLSKSEKMLGYRPKISMQEGLKRMVEWYRSKKAVAATV